MKSLSVHVERDAPLRIAGVTTEYPEPGAPQRGLFIQRRLKALSRFEDVRVVHLQPWFPWLRPMPARETLVNGPERPPVTRPRMFYIPGVLKRLDGYWVKHAVLRAVRDLDAAGKVDLLDAHFGYPEGVGCVMAAHELGRPVFITMRGLESQVLASRSRGSQLRWALQKCTGIVCVSESLRELALRHGVSPEKVAVIPNAVHRETYFPGDRAEARRSLGLNVEGQLVVAVGMLVYGKGHHLLIEAIARLRASHPDLRLALVGGPAHEPRYPQSLRKLVEKLGLADAVLLPGSQSPGQVTAWLRAADLFALPTFDEGCCNAILEAMACGLPIVTTPVGDNAVLVAAPQRGQLVPVDDVPALASALAQTLAVSWDREQIARYGEDYTWAEAARRTAGFFRDRLGGVERSTPLPSLPLTVIESVTFNGGEN